jgi:hypothetical protein
MGSMSELTPIDNLRLRVFVSASCSSFPHCGAACVAASAPDKHEAPRKTTAYLSWKMSFVEQIVLCGQHWCETAVRRMTRNLTWIYQTTQHLPSTNLKKSSIVLLFGRFSMCIATADGNKNYLKRLFSLT